ncbi:PEP-CTERM sorting domain-containing protein [Roseateles toxinivorans]|uniref:Putative secreted protein with PEP-CTERM sorting signal n=1 Tax=Roseateles toxinivorans TaxID=270368 RepID=A0A4R6QS59_9BURK|nr:PEP-CTERM sorting domain-containing protein [Roseateles toxinivorans]TDP74460.1 putative secreted protein with PEP-CTERM sorting signal [Roseateles toxinivorans]
MTTRMTKAISAVTVLLSASAAQAGFVDFVIRGTPTITYPGAGQTNFLVPKSGDKAGLGSNDINGRTLGSLQSVAITRIDDRSLFTPGSGPNMGPYLNFWITDGAGNYAVVANEPTNPDMQGLYNNGWDLSAADLANTTAKIYENSDKTWLPAATRDTNGDLINDAWAFSDLFSYEIKPPSIAELLDPGWLGKGTGLPRELGTNIAYGVNWVFGDTQGNYVTGTGPGYRVQDAAVSAVPEPATLGLVGLALLGVCATRRRDRG